MGAAIVSRVLFLFRIAQSTGGRTGEAGTAVAESDEDVAAEEAPGWAVAVPEGCLVGVDVKIGAINDK